MSSSSRLNLTPRFAETAPVFAVAPSPRAERGMGGEVWQEGRGRTLFPIERARR
jgi:hypothetical protein